MSSFALIIVLLLGAHGFGVQENPNPPSSDQVLEYAVPDADAVGYVDLASLIPGNYEILSHLADQPELKRLPELRQAVKELVAEIDGPRAAMKAATGIDPVHDLYNATVFVRYTPHADDDVDGLVAVRGRFSPQLLDRIASLHGGHPTHAGDATYVTLDDHDALGITHDGVLLAGTTALVTARLGQTWHAPVHHPDTTLGYVGETIEQHAVMSVVLAPSKAARTHVLAQLPPDGLAHDLATRGRVMSFAVFRDGIGWTWLDRDRRGLADMTKISEGTVDLLHAAQLAPRGVAEIALGALDSYRNDKELSKLMRFRPQFERFAAELASDSAFTAKVTPHPAVLRLDVRLTGKHAGSILPLALLIPAGGLLYLKQRAAPPASPPVLVQPAAQP